MADKYLIWSNVHNLWWGPDSRGYTLNIDLAGKYSREEALKICALSRDGIGSNPAPDELPVPLADISETWSIYEKKRNLTP